MNDTATLTEYLTFTLAGEVYALDVAHVREVLELVPITPLPLAPEDMRGVINMRGSAVPVLDLRLRFGLPGTENTINTSIIVLEVTDEDRSLVLGALVDSVLEVVDFDSSRIEPVPSLGTGLGADYLMGIGKRDENFVLILDVMKVLSGVELPADEVDTAVGTLT